MKPNIVYIHAHDAGCYVQPYGHAVPTPGIQRLAEDGVLFRNAFCASPTCSPGRAALETGQSAHGCGMFGPLSRGFEMRDRKKHIAHALGKIGYRTVLAGVQQVVNDPISCGYQRVLPVEQAGQPSDRDNSVAAAAAAFITTKPVLPFFLSVGFINPQRPFPKPGPQEDARYCRPPDPLPDTPETRADMAAFKAGVKIFDRGVGTVLHAIEEAQLTESTTVICTTDHGIAFPGMKCNLTDHGLRVMLVISGPGGCQGGKICDSMVSQIDIYPTLCDVAGVPSPDWLEGCSLIPAVSGHADEINEAVYAEVNYHAAYEPMRAVRTKRWKYIRRFTEHGRSLLADCEDSPSKSVLIGHGWADRVKEEEELYDLAFDPNEACDLAADPRAAATLGEMRGRLEQWMRRSRDPLLDGPIPPPTTAVVSEVTDVSPDDVWRRVKRKPGQE